MKQRRAPKVFPLMITEFQHGLELLELELILARFAG